MHKGLDPAATARKLRGVEPLHTYRSVLNGFPARLDAARLEQVRALPGVQAVQENARARRRPPGRPPRRSGRPPPAGGWTASTSSSCRWTGPSPSRATGPVSPPT
ncbi:protease inhibitor I9 family protein [Kitasatospora sp. NPDC049258]|uniref:protease inhibitor I9 family protein n=1 Tax=Kitasatospora sp. NPDC049258 TaxID=3155394 RepID=UPI00341BBB75